jgi:hypothetical protein
MNERSVVREAFALRLKLVTLELAELLGSNAKAYREFEVPKSSFYRWKKAFAKEGQAGLTRIRG